MNAPVEWGGATWGAYIWDFVANETPRGRNELLLHELFHGVQPQLGLTVPALANEHLDAVDGRYWLRLEWRALARALRESGEQRHAAVRDALAFRQARRALYPAGVESERAAEITEGLAAYTGTVVAAAVRGRRDRERARPTGRCGDSRKASFARLRTRPVPPMASCSMRRRPAGRDRVRGTDDLATLVMNALAVQPATDATASAARYGGAELRAVRTAARATAAGTCRRVAPAVRRRSGAPDSGRRPRQFRFPGRGRDSGHRDGVLRCLPLFRRLGHARSGRRACSSRAMAARVVCPRRCGATTGRFPETDGRSRRRRDGWFAKEHGGATTKSSGLILRRHRLQVIDHDDFLVTLLRLELQAELLFYRFEHRVAAAGL